MPFKIRQLFHLIHMTDDFETLDAWYWDVFQARGGWGNPRSMPYLDIEKRYADLVAIGDAVIEPMAPAMDKEGWDELPVGRFYNRFGRHWHSIAWYVDEILDLYDQLKASGIRFFALGGGSVAERPTSPVPLYTHPKDSVGALELMQRHLPANKLPPGGDPRFLPAYDPNWWARNHPLGVQGISHVSVVTSELEKAKRVYVDILGGRQLHERDSALTDTHGLYVAVGDNTVVELAVPGSTASIAGMDLEKNGAMVHAVTWKVVDLDRAAKHLAEKGIRIVDRDDTTLVADPEDTFGAVMRFTTWAIPDDPRFA